MSTEVDSRSECANPVVAFPSRKVQAICHNTLTLWHKYNRQHVLFADASCGLPSIY